MVSILMPLLYTVIVIISILLIGLVLLQPSKGGGFGSAFGGVGENVFGAHALSHLSKMTIALVSVFFVLTLALAVISGHMHKSNASLVQTLGIPSPVEAPAVPAKGATPETKTPAKTETAPEKPQSAAQAPAGEAPKQSKGN
jgi:preprotein translocase subunit SecG